MVSPQGRREQCVYACGRGIPKRRACGLTGMARSTLSYELRQPAKALGLDHVPEFAQSAKHPRRCCAIKASAQDRAGLRRKR